MKLNGTPLSTIAAAPQVQTVQYESIYTPQSASGTDDPDLTLIHAPQAWGGNGANAGVSVTGGGLRTAGPRVKVAIVDTGIDQTHPCFDPAGYSYPPGFPKGDTSLTTPKVIVARVFNMMTQRFGFTPAAIQEHGTHVAGTVACDYGLTHNTTIVNGVTVTYGVNGVAPGAQLGNYNVFPSVITPNGEVDVLNARSEDIMNALEAAYRDGMDVANMSLGGNARGKQDLLTITVNNLDEAGMVVAVAAGNSGPGHFTVESPGSAVDALTAGASTVGHIIGGRRHVRLRLRERRRRPVRADHAKHHGAARGPQGRRREPGHGSQPCVHHRRAPRPDGEDRPRLARRVHVLGEDPERTGGRGSGRDRREQRRRRSDRDGSGRHAGSADDSGRDGLEERRRSARRQRRRADDDPRESAVLPDVEFEHHRRLLEPGADGRRLPRQAGRRRAGRQRPQLDPDAGSRRPIRSNARRRSSAAGRSSRVRRWRRRTSRDLQPS